MEFWGRDEMALAAPRLSLRRNAGGGAGARRAALDRCSRRVRRVSSSRTRRRARRRAPKLALASSRPLQRLKRVAARRRAALGAMIGGRCRAPGRSRPAPRPAVRAAQNDRRGCNRPAPSPASARWRGRSPPPPRRSGRDRPARWRGCNVLGVVRAERQRAVESATASSRGPCRRAAWRDCRRRRRKPGRPRSRGRSSQGFVVLVLPQVGLALEIVSRACGVPTSSARSITLKPSAIWPCCSASTRDVIERVGVARVLLQDRDIALHGKLVLALAVQRQRLLELRCGAPPWAEA